MHGTNFLVVSGINTRHAAGSGSDFMLRDRIMNVVAIRGASVYSTDDLSSTMYVFMNYENSMQKIAWDLSNTHVLFK
jgi:hypothetical protein